MSKSNVCIMEDRVTVLEKDSHFVIKALDFVHEKIGVVNARIDKLENASSEVKFSTPADKDSANVVGKIYGVDKRRIFITLEDFLKVHNLYLNSEVTSRLRAGAACMSDGRGAAGKYSKCGVYSINALEDAARLLKLF